MRTFTTSMFVVFTFMVFFNSAADAQRSPLRVNQGFRYLGHFQSGGYHWRTPGPCVGYYNPYSAHNSMLRTGGVPQGAEPYVSNFYQDATPYSNFDVPGRFQPLPSREPPSPNEVPSVIDDSDDEIEATEGSDAMQELRDEVGEGSELDDLEREVQSILNDGENESEIPEGAFRPSYNRFGYSRGKVRSLRYPIKSQPRYTQKPYTVYPRRSNEIRR